MNCQFQRPPTLLKRLKNVVQSSVLVLAIMEGDRLCVSNGADYTYVGDAQHMCASVSSTGSSSNSTNQKRAFSSLTLS